MMRFIQTNTLYTPTNKRNNLRVLSSLFSSFTYDGRALCVYFSVFTSVRARGVFIRTHSLSFLSFLSSFWLADRRRIIQFKERFIIGARDMGLQYR